MSAVDLHVITTVENPATNGGRSGEESSQSSAPPMTGLVQPSQPHWPQHITTPQNHHLQNYILDDDDTDDLDFDDYGGSGPGTPGGPSSPSSSTSRSKRGGPTKRSSTTGARKSNSKTRKKRNGNI